MRRNEDDLENGATAVSAAYRPDGEAAARSFVLRVVEGPDAGAALALDDATAFPILVGQSPACALRLADPEISRRHLSIDLAGARLRITDLGSTNGTSIGGVAVNDAFVVGGELVRLGATTLRVESAAASPSAAIPTGTRFGQVLGVSPAMRRLYPLMERLARSMVPVVIEGETGTGKEVLAEMLHALSPRASRPFVVFDCTTVPPQLMEAELFGHERGAFTGAATARRGLFEEAQGGTLLIDEIGELDVGLQAKLLRAIERGEIRRVGAARMARVDVRVLAATRRNLDDEVQAGRFRDDLFYRLAVGRIELPPLRRREGDVRLLASHFWAEMGGDPRELGDDVLAHWERAPWPGNVRQLRNAVARRLAGGDLLPAGGVDEDADESSAPAALLDDDARHDDVIANVIAAALPLPVARLQVVKEFERRYIEAVLAKHGGNVARAAEASGIARRYFQILRGGTRR